jgi:hypothetical protein
MFEDDRSLVGGTKLLRVLIDKNWCALNQDGSERASSAAFLESTNEASCFVIDETDLSLIKERFPGKKWAVLAAEDARKTGFIVARDEEGGEGIPGHVVLVQVSVRPQSKQHVRLARQLAYASQIVQPS